MRYEEWQLHLSTEETVFMSMMRRIMPRPHTLEEERDDLRKAQQRGDTAARDRLVAANARTVVLEVRSYARKGVLFYTPSLEITDLFQEGVLGVHDAINHFDEEIGFRLGVYAKYRVRDFLSLAVNGAQRVSVPGRYLARCAAAFNQRERALTLTLSREPTQSEFLRSFGSKTKINGAARIQHFLSSTGRAMGAAAVESGDDEDVPEQQFLDDQRLQPDMELALKQQSLLFSLLAEALKKCRLSERARFVIEHRYCDEKFRMTHESIGKKFGITASRICQLEADTIRKIRSYMQRHAGPPEESFVEFRDA